MVDTDHTVAGVARQIGVEEALLGRWVNLEKATPGPASGLFDEPERAELERLRTEVQQLRMDNKFLGKAAALVAAKTSPGNVSR